MMRTQDLFRAPRGLVAILTLAGAVFLAGCDESVTDPPTPVAAQVEVSPATVNLTEVGATAALTATVRDTEGQVIANAAVTWSSSDSDVAAVNQAGTVQANGEGSATITARSGEATGTAQVTVDLPEVPEPTQIVLDPEEVTLSEIGATAQFTATALDAEGMEVQEVEFTWASSDEGVATVDGEGLVEAVGAGSTILTATVGDISGSAQVTVELEQPSAAEIRVSPEVAFLTEIGATVELQSTVLDAEGTEIGGAVVEWTSSDENVATVSGDGVVAATGAGMATITASSDEVSGSAEVTVDPDAGTPAAIDITPEEVTLAEIGNTAELTATVRDEEGTEIPGVPLMWTTSDANVAVVSREGVVEAVGEGSATITASIGEASGTAEVSVEGDLGDVAAEVLVEPEEVTLTAIGGTAELTASVRDAEGMEIENAEVEWSSSDEAVATVDENGVVEAVGAGTATITAAVGEVSGTAAVTVAPS